MPSSSSTSTTDCIVPAFVLGSASEMADIVADILEEHSDRASMRPKDLSKELVHRYTARIAKSVRHALNTAIEVGKIQVDDKGNICRAYIS
ncbi:unnamed protein product [Phytomonas sp. EM1]|nr:unnamed protein product [Phytomonas sp. EM1]|eukprot:CCW59650.1 unnamed protein product [Phytomonas sp. isolate EM1]